MRVITNGSIFDACRIEKERMESSGRVVGAGRVVVERIRTDSRVVHVGRIVHKRIITEEGVRIEGIAAVVTNRLSCRRKWKAHQGEGNPDQKSPDWAAVAGRAVP